MRTIGIAITMLLLGSTGGWAQPPGGPPPDDQSVQGGRDQTAEQHNDSTDVDAPEDQEALPDSAPTLAANADSVDDEDRRDWMAGRFCDGNGQFQFAINRVLQVTMPDSIGHDFFLGPDTSFIRDALFAPQSSPTGGGDGEQIAHLRLDENVLLHISIPPRNGLPARTALSTQRYDRGPIELSRRSSDGLVTVRGAGRWNDEPLHAC
jgi:hypothetical protein